MKSFLISIFALVVITVAANQILLAVDYSQAETSKTDRSVRLD
jgi:hypothetical protein